MRAARELRLGPRPGEFIWASGVEDTFVPQSRPGHRALDEYALMGHYEHWREDLALAREVGLQALRWGVPWYRVEPSPGTFDWRWTDQVLPYLVEDLGVTPIVDLMHYGCPFWLDHEFASQDYPRAVAGYAAAFARRYAGLVRWYTPLNEPLVNAEMCGRRGRWPPYLRGDRSYVRVMLRLVEGLLDTVAAIREADPAAVMVHVEATGLTRSAREDVEPLAAEERVQRFLAYDLLTGRVTPEHPLFTWLLRSGAPPDHLAAIARRRISLDVLGLNFYPQWSTQELRVDRQGRLVRRPVDQEGTGFAGLVEDYHRRYGVPVLVTETSAHGSEDLRARWLDASVSAIKRLRAQGVPVLGYTWFPLFTMIDWRYRFGRRPLDNYRLELGLFTLDARDGGQRWRATPLMEQLRAYVHDPEGAVGPLREVGGARP
jgi:beta-glucosidase